MLIAYALLLMKYSQIKWTFEISSFDIRNLLMCSLKYYAIKCQILIGQNLTIWHQKFWLGQNLLNRKRKKTIRSDTMVKFNQRKLFYLIRLNLFCLKIVWKVDKYMYFYEFLIQFAISLILSLMKWK